MRSSRRGTLLTALVLGAIAAPASASGGATCAISTTPLAFGQYVPARNMPSDFTATLDLACAASGASSVAFEGSISLVASGRGPELADGANRLRYQLFADPARTVPWGDGSAGSQSRAVSGLIGPATPLRARFTIYGRILARQPNAQVGNYTDQITAVLNY